ncbi:MAG: hypothetical protein ACREAE_01835, partial [Nitrosopumilaceae archaeon]
TEHISQRAATSRVEAGLTKKESDNKRANEFEDELLSRRKAQRATQKVEFAHNLRDYKKMGNDELKRLYLVSLSRVGNQNTTDDLYDEIVKIGNELGRRGIDTTRLPNFPDVDDLGEVLTPDTPLEEADKEQFAQDIQQINSFNTRKKLKDFSFEELTHYHQMILNAYSEMPLALEQERREALQELGDVRDEMDSRRAKDKIDYDQQKTGQNDEKPEFQHALEETNKKAFGMIGRRYDDIMEFVRSSSDTLKRETNPIIKKLGIAIQDMVDYAQANRGIMQKYLTPMTKKLDKMSKDDRQVLMVSFEQWVRLNQTDTKKVDEFYKNADAELKSVIDSVQNAFNAAGDKMEKLGVLVYDPMTGRRRPFRKLKNFFPNILKPEYRDALANPMTKVKGEWVYSNKFKELADHLIKAGYKVNEKPIKTYKEAEAYVT